MNAIAIIAASGIGKRMQLENGMSKQMLEIGGQPVIRHTLNAFQEAATVSAIYIATRSESIPVLEALGRQAGITKLKAVLEGGRERQDSVRNAVRAITADAQTEGSMPEAILVHDGARPFIRPDEIDAIALLSLRFGACVPANRPKDTIKFVGDNPEYFGATLDRSRLLQVQTPQGFRTELLTKAHEEAALAGVYATDDAALVERYFPDNPIKIYETGYHNIKITTPEDLPIAEVIWQRLLEQSS